MVRGIFGLHSANGFAGKFRPISAFSNDYRKPLAKTRNLAASSNVNDCGLRPEQRVSIQ